jgi:hypothetical protein
MQREKKREMGVREKEMDGERNKLIGIYEKEGMRIRKERFEIYGLNY